MEHLGDTVATAGCTRQQDFARASLVEDSSGNMNRDSKGEQGAALPHHSTHIVRAE
jgi:hypothetical protein